MHPEPDTLRVKAIFEKAIDFTSTDDRQGYLNGTCNGDATLLARVQTLLRAHFENGESFLPENPAAALAPRIAVGVEEKPGDVIGRYKLLQKVGEGGCGVVWMAEQGEPVRRRVALKVIKLGMDTRSVIARFEAERQALAMMDHPCIAKVHDAGSTDTGRPFFVMELVRGIPITKYCDENHLPPKARLELFIKVCQAVQHAHQKGIIHRDLKPSNILVTVNDGAPTPKIIDFGIAKATQGRLTDATVFTAFEQFIGTPVYMSPEQAEMSSLDIDTRSDIYSLGVLLYELLTGKPPFDPKAFAQAGVDQIRQRIREIEPPTPSRRLHTLGEDERTTIARLRGTGPAHLSLLLRGDLDWIVMRCLEKDRTRRYDTANGLAMDIQRHLRNEPVVARPPSAAYLLHKLIRRHRLEFAATVAIGAVFVIGGIVSAWQAIRATRAEREQASLRETAQQAQISEAKLRRAAEIEAFAVRLQAYASDMNLVQQALAVDNLGRAQELLDRHRPLPGQRDLRGWEWRYLWQFCQSDALPVFSQKTISISSVTVSSDATWLAVAEGDNGGLSIWNLHSRKETRLSAGDGFVYAAFSPRTPLLAVSIVTGSTSTNRSHRVLLWNAATAQKVNEIELSEQCTKLAFSEDGRTLVTSGMGTKNQIAVWRVPDGKKLAAYSAPARVIFRQPSFVHSPLAITGDTRLAAYTSPDKKVRVIDLTAGQERWSADATNDRLVALAFSPDGRILVTSAGFSESDVRLWDVASGKELGRLEGHRGFVQAIVFWPDGKTLASASGDQTIRLWDVKTRALLKTLRGHKLEVHSLALFPDGRTLASGCKDGAVYLWDTAATRAGTAHVRLPKPIFAWQFAADSKSVVTVDPDGRIERWNGDMFETRSEAMEIGKIRGAESVQIITDPPMVAVGTSAGQAQVWDWAQRVRLWQFNASSEAVYPIKFLGNGTKLILAYGTERNELHTLHEWDLTTGKDIRFWAGLPNSRSFYVGFSSDERWCLMLGEGASKLYGLATGREINPNLNLSQPRSPALSPDGRLFATASAAAHVQLWDATTFREIAALSGFMKGLSSVAFSPDGQRLVTGGTGMEAVKLWDLESHSCVLTLEGKGSLFAKIAFSADGTVLGSLSNPGVLHLWRAPSWPEIEAAEKLAASSRAAQ